MTLQAQSALDLARNIERNERAAQAKKARNKDPDSEADLLRDIASARLPEKYHLEAICRRACRDFPSVEPDQLINFLTVAGDSDWCSERCARRLAECMAEGMIR